jgi:hypothetical protein
MDSGAGYWAVDICIVHGNCIGLNEGPPADVVVHLFRLVANPTLGLPNAGAVLSRTQENPAIPASDAASASLDYEPGRLWQLLLP